MHQLRIGTKEHKVSNSERTNQRFDLVTSAQPDWYGVVTYCLSLISSLIKFVLGDIFPPTNSIGAYIFAIYDIFYAEKIIKHFCCLSLVCCNPVFNSFKNCNIMNFVWVNFEQVFIKHCKVSIFANFN